LPPHERSKTTDAALRPAVATTVTKTTTAAIAARAQRDAC
jgi:hypothetical protein